MKKLLGVQGKYGWARAHELARMLLGSEKAKLPVEGRKPQVIQGITVYIVGLQQGPMPRNQWGRFLKRRFALRVRGICPICHKHMALSRLPQHSVVH